MPKFFKIPYHSFTFRFAFAYVGLFSLSVLLIVLFIYLNTGGIIRHQNDENIKIQVDNLVEDLKYFGRSGLINNLEKLSADSKGRYYYLLLDQNNEKVAGNMISLPKRYFDSKGWHSLDIIAEDNPDKHFPIRGFVHKAGRKYTLFVGSNITEQQRFHDMIVWSITWSILLMGALGIIGGFVMTRGVNKRLESINTTSRKIIQGDLTQRIPNSGSQDEFDTLADNLNQMLSQIEDLLNGLRDVTGNIVHDLRSPLNKLRSRLELALQSKKKNEDYPLLIQQSVKEIDDILTTFNALLNIAQLESGSSRASFSNIEVGTICTDVMELYDPLLQDKNMTFVADIKSDIMINGNRDLIFQALVNLIENSIKFCADGAKIFISVQDSDEDMELTVADNGPGVPHDQLSKIAEKFFRGESSRTTPGNGLGLSLVSAVVKMHGGKIHFSDNQPGLKTTIIIPKID